jgi:hypothetical protein
MLDVKLAKRSGDGPMPLEEITLALFAACNSFRVVAYVPQILKAVNDKNGHLPSPS